MARNEDIRVSLDFFDHWKTKALQDALGDAGVNALIRLRAWTARFKPSGVINGLAHGAVESAVHWRGQPGEFVAELLKIGFLDQTEAGLVVHDWAVHNPYAYHLDHRKAEGKAAARRRWDAYRANLGLPSGSPNGSPTGSPNGSPSGFSMPPIPIPIPIPIPSAGIGSPIGEPNGLPMPQADQAKAPSPNGGVERRKTKRCGWIGGCTKTASVREGNTWYCSEHAKLLTDQG